MSLWDDRYREARFRYGERPNDFLTAHTALLPGPKILCVAEGEGRNAVYLAECGHDVLAVDQSAVGLANARVLASARGVTIATEAADLATFEIAPRSWDGIVSIFAHVPAATRRRLHRAVVAGLRSGGLLLLEAYTLRQLETGGVGGPSAAETGQFMSADALRTELDGLVFDRLIEIDRVVDEVIFIAAWPLSCRLWRTSLDRAIKVAGTDGRRRSRYCHARPAVRDRPIRRSADDDR